MPTTSTRHAALLLSTQQALSALAVSCGALALALLEARDAACPPSASPSGAAGEMGGASPQASPQAVTAAVSRGIPARGGEPSGVAPRATCEEVAA